MELVRFRVTDYRSIKDSGAVEVNKIVALVGRNESGKSNLLKALSTVENAETFGPLNRTKDFPRDRKLSECKDSTIAVRTTWKLTADEQKELQAIFPRSAGVQFVDVSRGYGAIRYVAFEGLADLAYDRTKIAANVRKLGPSVELAIDSAPEEKRDPVRSAWQAAQKKLGSGFTATVWAKAAAEGAAEFRKALMNAEARLNDEGQTILDELDEASAAILEDEPAFTKGRSWVVTSLPIFILLDDYPDIPGQQNIANYVARATANPPQTDSRDRYFEKLLKVAGLSAEELHKLKDSGEYEARNLLVNRAGSVVSAQLKRLWKDRPLKVRFNIDGDHFETLVSDPTDTYDVEVNLDERSRGFKWFFSFYITFAADTSDGDADNAILLLDEPGLFLHALSQDDLLAHFENDFANQILYTTHSPFMVPPRMLPFVRTVNIAEGVGTTVTNDPTGDRRTLFPLQSALGYSLAQSLFVAERNLICEGVTDFWILSSVSEYLKSIGRHGLTDGAAITPAGSAQKTPYMVSLLTSQGVGAVILLDAEAKAKSEKDRMVREKIIHEENVLFASDAFDNPPPQEADIEDVIGEDIYLALVREAYEKELAGKTLTLNPKIPRIEKRTELAFAEAGVSFQKTRPASLFMRKMALDPAAVTSTEMLDRFEKLFGILNGRLEKTKTVSAR